MKEENTEKKTISATAKVREIEQNAISLTNAILKQSEQQEREIIAFCI